MNFLRFAALLLAGAGLAQAELLGLGVMVGEPSGLTAKSWLDKTHAVDLGLAYSLSGDTDLQVHADYLIHNFGLLADSGIKGRLPFYYGLGGRLRLREGSGDDGKDKLGVRVPLGVSWYPPDTQLDIFLELVPVVDLIPDTEAGLNGALGVRFWFK
ncbi:MAG: hypothetical protein WC326_13370 [Candidatus Delongbacteria bacterium]